MANKQALRELQNRLAERLQAARTQDRGKSWLAVECGDRGFLFPLLGGGFLRVAISSRSSQALRANRTWRRFTAAGCRSSKTAITLARPAISKG